MLYWELCLCCGAARAMRKAPLSWRPEGSLMPEICPGLSVEQVEPTHIEVDRHFMHRACGGRRIQASHKGMVSSPQLDDHFISEGFDHVHLGSHPFLPMFSGFLAVGDILRANTEHHILVYMAAIEASLAFGQLHSELSEIDVEVGVLGHQLAPEEIHRW